MKRLIALAAVLGMALGNCPVLAQGEMTHDVKKHTTPGGVVFYTGKNPHNYKSPAAGIKSSRKSSAKKTGGNKVSKKKSSKAKRY